MSLHSAFGVVDHEFDLALACQRARNLFGRQLLPRQSLDDAAFEDWAWHPELQIEYVSTYRRVR